MENLIRYIDNLYKWSTQTPQFAKTFYNEAFGAFQFYILDRGLSGDEYTELETLWNTKYRPNFEAIIYGGAENA